MDDSPSMLGWVIGGVATAAASVVTYFSTRSSNRTRSSIMEQKLDLEGQKIEIQERKADAVHYENIIAGYKDLLEQKQRAVDWIRQEVHDLRDKIHQVQLVAAKTEAALREEISTLRVAHAAELDGLKVERAKCIVESDQMRVEINHLRTEVDTLKAERAPLGSLTPRG